jgi:ATP-dependent DNA ligase
MLRPPVEPMLARPVEQLPHERALPGGCGYEPKVDGYRALLFVSDRGCLVQSRRGKDLSGSFPDIAAATGQLPPGMVVDGELAVLGADGVLDFAALQHRLVGGRHARALAAEQPASYVAFDLLWHPTSGDLRSRPFAFRREALERLLQDARPPLQLCPQTSDYDTATAWMLGYAAAAVGLEGLVVKGLASRYEPGRRGWLKVRVRHTAEAIVGAVTGSLDEPERLVLGYYDNAGALIVAGSTSPLSARQRATIAPLLRAPGGPHPWPTEMPTGRLGHYGRDRITVKLVDPTLVVEVSADNAYEHGRWRHLTRFVRARPDLTPDDVTPPADRP